APAVYVSDDGGKTKQLMVIDPSLNQKPTPVAEWEATMKTPGGRTLITGPNQIAYNQPEKLGQARVKMLAESLAYVAGVRQWYPLRDAAQKAKDATTPTTK